AKSSRGAVAFVVTLAVPFAVGCGGSKQPDGTPGDAPPVAVEMIRDPGGPSPLGGPPAPGQIMSPFLQDRLQLSDGQKKQLEALQKEADEKLGQILTDEQKGHFKDMPDGSGRGGPGT